MQPTEKTIKIAAKLYEARDTARKLFGDKYTDVIANWQDLIREVMVATGHDAIDVAIELAKDEQLSEVERYVLIAAAAEVVEARNG